MLKAVSAYLDIFARAVIVSRGLSTTSSVLNEVHRLSIINYLGDAEGLAAEAKSEAASQDVPSGLAHAA